MDLICKESVRSDLIDLLGKKLIILQGQGGTGKTVRLLQMAWKAFEEKAKRVLILTYNTALCADLERMFYVMGLSDITPYRTIKIQTLHSFLRKFFIDNGLITKENYDPGKHNNYVREIWEYIKIGALGDEDFIKFKKEMNYNYIFIDEGQDWMDEERDLLYKLHSPNEFVIAVGYDQLVRSDNPCDWTKDLFKNSFEIKALTRCLRMKSNISNFVNFFAEAMKVQWRINPDFQATGGRVFIIEGDYFKNKSIHDELMKDNESAQNEPIDMLVCLPEKGEYGNKFTEWGQEIWNGTIPEKRRKKPTSNNQLRIVHYKSCRGLEGWIVINLRMDLFYDDIFRQWFSYSQSVKEAHNYASSWVRIPLTRAIDTLVIQVENKESFVYKALKEVFDRCNDDFIRWIAVSSNK